VCTPGAVVAFLEQGCDRLPWLKEEAADRCCEQLGLLNSALCFCDLALDSLVGDRGGRAPRR
jgi:hypothetical protein